MYWRLAAILGVLTFATVACSIVDDGRVERVSPPAELTGTLPPTTIATTTTTEAVTTTIGLATTTTDVQGLVDVFFIASGKLSPVPRPISAQYVLSQLIAKLLAGPPEGEVGLGLRSAIPPDLEEITASTDGSGVAQVVLPDGFFDTIPAGDQRLAVAQIVMTLLENTPGIGQVAFNLQVSGPEGELIPAGQLLTRADFVSLMADSPSVLTATTLAEVTTLAP
jgi:hypothetical protein